MNTDRPGLEMKDLPEPVIPVGIQADRMPSLLENWFLGSKAKRWLSRRRFVAVTGMLPAGMGRRALDVGCGWGYNLFLLGLRGYAPYGIDIVQNDFAAASMIAAANGTQSRLSCADMSALPFGDGTFAAVTAVETFEHVFHPDRRSAVREAWRVLEPGGALVLSTPNYYSFVETGKRVANRLPFLKRALPGMCYPVGEIERSDYHPYRYHRPSPEGEIRSMLEDEGFEVTGSQRIIFVLKNLPDPVFPLARGLEAVMERTPPISLLASTLVLAAVRPGIPPDRPADAS
jgi:ubiquinone/menaquinone biosynthesis C-methylase UbiE